MELADIPAGLPPPGVTPNFVNPPSLRDPTITANAVFLSLSTVFVLLRIYTRKWLTRMLKWDDFACVIALLGAAAHSALLIHAVNQGAFGRHMWDIPLIKLTPSVSKIVSGIPLAYAPTIFFVKLSMLLFLNQLFGVNKTMKYLIYFGIIFQALFYLAVVGVYTATEITCVSALSLTHSLCRNQVPLAVTKSVINVVTDLYVLVLPVAKVIRLQLSPRRKIGISAIFLTGLLAVVASVARLILIINHFHSDDLLWDAASTSLLSCCEINAGIICACMPVMPTFFKYHRFVVPRLGSFRTPLLGKKVSEGTPPKTLEYFKVKTFRGIATLDLTKPTPSINESEYTEVEGVCKNAA